MADSIGGSNYQENESPRITYGQRRLGFVKYTQDGVIRSCRICGTEYEDADLIGGSYCSPECKEAADFRVARMEIFGRDNHTCVYCGASPFLRDGVILHVDHVAPFSKGGKTTAENLVTSCSECNLSKSSKDLRASVLEAVLSIVAERNRTNDIEPSKFYAALELNRDSR